MPTTTVKDQAQAHVLGVPIGTVVPIFGANKGQVQNGGTMRTLATIVLMRTPRIKVSAEEAQADYHYMSRTVVTSGILRTFSERVVRRKVSLPMNEDQPTETTAATADSAVKPLGDVIAKYQTIRLEVIEGWLRGHAPEGGGPIRDRFKTGVR